jgi:hypothetical protein
MANKVDISGSSDVTDGDQTNSWQTAEEGFGETGIGRALRAIEKGVGQVADDPFADALDAALRVQNFARDMVDLGYGYNPPTYAQALWDQLTENNIPPTPYC